MNGPTLTEFVLARIAEQPASQRIALYRALAADTSDKILAANCRSVANILEDVERNHLQLVLDFQRRNAK
jgi:hypothetical protein